MSYNVAFIFCKDDANRILKVVGYTPEPLQDDCPPVFPQDHFLKWVTIYRSQTYNELLCEYNDFCKFNPEKADTL